MSRLPEHRKDLTHFEQLFRDLQPRLYAYCCKYIEDREIARDIVQECFINLWENYESVVVSYEYYLFKAVHNRCLSHGSTVWINTCSSITYDNTFGEKDRVVNMKGEAYFNVKKDKTRPFLVRADKFTFRITGTSFNVYSFDDEEEVSISKSIRHFVRCQETSYPVFQIRRISCRMKDMVTNSMKVSGCDIPDTLIGHRLIEKDCIFVKENRIETSNTLKR